MKVLVHVREKTLAIHCGEGRQLIRWLAHVGVHRYDDDFGLELGAPVAVKTEAGDALDFERTVVECLADGEHCWVILE